jgi:hypothetical protein
MVKRVNAQVEISSLSFSQFDGSAVPLLTNISTSLALHRMIALKGDTMQQASALWLT